MAESTESELSTESTEEKQSPVDFQMTEFKLSDQITEKEKQSRVVFDESSIDNKQNRDATLYTRRRSSIAKLAIERLVRTRERLWATTISAIVSAIPALLAGYTIGFPSFALLEFQRLSSDHQLGDSLTALFVSFASVGALFGGPIAGLVADRWGRKVALLLTGVPYLVGYLMMTLAHLIGDATAFKAVLLTGRLLSGVGMGWSCMAGAGATVQYLGLKVDYTKLVYHGEISSAKLRGIYGTFTQIFIGVGLLLVYGIGSIEGLSYYFVALVAVGIVIAFELLMVWLKETPRWLLSKGHKKKSIAALKFLRGPEIGYEKELSEMEAALSESTNQTMFQVLKEFKKRSVLIPFLILVVILFFQQIGGLNAISAYAATIFKQANIESPQFIATITVGIAGLLASIFSIFLVDVAGRKLLLIVGGIGTCLATALLGTHFFITRPSLCDNSTNLTATLPPSAENATTTAVLPCNPQYAPVAIASVLLYFVLFNFGWGPVPWVLLGEMLPLQVRGVASGIVIFVNWGTSAIVTGSYPAYNRAVMPWFAWWSFAVMNFASVVFVTFALSETKGKTLEEIQKRFERKKK